MITGVIVARAIAALALSFALGAHAQVYRWLDENGRLHAGDTPPPSAREVEKVRVAPTPTEPVEPYALQIARKNNPVTLYSTPKCPLCDRARELLKARGVPFSEKSVVTDQQVEELERIVGRNALPSLVVGTKIQDGFAGSLYEAMLDDAGYPKKGALPARKQEPAAAAQPPLGPYAPRAK